MSERRATHDPAVTAALEEFMAEGWAAPNPMLGGIAPVAGYAATRRARLAAEMPTLTLVVPVGVAAPRSGDTTYRWRPATEFLYLVGAPVPGAVLVIGPDGDRLYAPDPAARGTKGSWASRDGSLWEGPQPTRAEWGAHLELTVEPIESLAAHLADRRWVALDPLGQASLPDTGTREHELEPLALALAAEQRLVKDSYELGELGLAAQATGLAFADLARELRPGVSERWLEGSFTRRARVLGQDCGYLPIVATGSHACTLHWSVNDGTTQPGDALLVDAGVELASGYTADITRVLPVSGRFDATQREVIAAVADAQAAGIAALTPGAPFSAAHEAAMTVLCERLCEWGLFRASPAEVLELGLHRRYTLHGTSHMLGLDVHDCASARDDLYRGPLMPGMVLTVEPGLYFQPDDLLAPPSLRGLGVRLEDDCVITPTGVHTLATGVPADPDGMEVWFAALHGRS